MRTAGPACLTVLAAVLAVAFAAPVWLMTTLTAVAFVLTAGRLVRRRQLGWADALVTGAAGVVIVLMLLGFALDEVPGGLARVPWAVGAGIVALVAIAWAERQTPPGAVVFDVDRPAVFRLAPAYALAGGLAVVALLISVHATRQATQAPPALSIVRASDAGEVAVEISAGHVRGTYELVVRSNKVVGDEIGPFDVAQNGHVTKTVQVPVGRRSVVELRAPGSDRTLRALPISPRTLGRRSP